MHKPVIKILLFLFFASAHVFAQEKTLPQEAKPFVLPGYDMLDYITGDLNNDKKQDAILLLKQNMEDTSYDELKRPMIILLRQADRKLQQVKRNDDVIMCRQCGGAFGDPYEGIEIKNAGFNIRFYGGSSWRWSFDYSFRYDSLKTNWYLVKEKQVNYHSTDMDKTWKEITLPAAELGTMAIDSFNGNAGFTQTKWKVAAAKTYFFNNPKTGSKPRKAFLLKGDVVSSYRQTKNFVQVYFENKKAQSSSGFVLKKDMVKIE
jgi:hypothetical protein